MVEPDPAGLREPGLCQIPAGELEQGLTEVFRSLGYVQTQPKLCQPVKSFLWHVGKGGNSRAVEHPQCSPAQSDTCARAQQDYVLHSSQSCSQIQPCMQLEKVKRLNTLGKCFYLFSLGAYMAITRAAWSRMLKTISLCSINKGLMWFNCINYAILLSGVVKGKFRQRALPLQLLLLCALLVLTCSSYTTEMNLPTIIYHHTTDSSLARSFSYAQMTQRNRKWKSRHCCVLVCCARYVAIQ